MTAATPVPEHDSSEDGPYAGLSPYGIAVTALERILDLDADHGSWYEARAIASEAATLAVARSASVNLAEREPQPAPGIPLRSDAETCDMLRADLADAEARRDRERIARLHMAGERDEARAQLTNTLGWFTSNGSGHTARVSATILARAYRNGRLTVPEELRRYL